MSRKIMKQYRYPYMPKPAVAGHHGELSAHVCACRDGWCWEVREDGETIKRGTNAALDDGMAAARYFLLEKLTPEERALEMDYHSGNPQLWQEERPRDDHSIGKRSIPPPFRPA